MTGPDGHQLRRFCVPLDHVYIQTHILPIHSTIETTHSKTEILPPDIYGCNEEVCDCVSNFFRYAGWILNAFYFSLSQVPVTCKGG